MMGAKQGTIGSSQQMQENSVGGKKTLLHYSGSQVNGNTLCFDDGKKAPFSISHHIRN